MSTFTDKSGASQTFADKSGANQSHTDKSGANQTFTDGSGANQSHTDKERGGGDSNALLIQDGAELLVERGDVLVIQDSSVSDLISFTDKSGN